MSSSEFVTFLMSSKIEVANKDSYDDKLVINSKKSQTLSAAKDLCILRLNKNEVHKSFAA
jgi:hypothetical protein